MHTTRFFIQWPVLATTGRLRIHRRLPPRLSPLLSLGSPLGAIAVSGLLNRPWVTRISSRQLALLLKLLCRVAIGGLLLLLKLLCRVAIGRLLLLLLLKLLCRVAIGRLLLLLELLCRVAIGRLLLLLGRIARCLMGLLLDRRILSLPLRRRDLDRDGLPWHSIPGLCFKPFILSISTTTAHNDNDQQQRSKSHTSVADFPESGRLGGCLLVIVCHTLLFTLLDLSAASLISGRRGNFGSYGLLVAWISPATAVAIR